MAKSIVKSISYPREFETEDFKRLYKERDFNLSTLFRDGVEAIFELERRPKRLISALESHGLVDIINDPLHFDFSKIIRDTTELYATVPDLPKWLSIYDHDVALSYRVSLYKKTLLRCRPNYDPENGHGLTQDDNLRAIGSIMKYVNSIQYKEELCARFRVEAPILRVPKLTLVTDDHVYLSLETSSGKPLPIALVFAREGTDSSPLLDLNIYNDVTQEKESDWDYPWGDNLLKTWLEASNRL